MIAGTDKYEDNVPVAAARDVLSYQDWLTKLSTRVWESTNALAYVWYDGQFYEKLTR